MAGPAVQLCSTARAPNSFKEPERNISMAARRFIAQAQHIAAFVQKVHLGAVFLAHSLEFDDKGAWLFELRAT